MDGTFLLSPSVDKVILKQLEGSTDNEDTPTPRGDVASPTHPRGEVAPPTPEGGHSTAGKPLDSMVAAGATASPPPDDYAAALIKNSFPTEEHMRANGFIRDRVWMFKTWKQCFVGKEVVRW